MVSGVLHGPLLGDPDVTMGGAPCFRRAFAPTIRFNPETGGHDDVLFTVLFGAIFVHPERWDLFVEWLRSP